MTDTVITVQGSASEWVDAERATLTVQVSHDGPKRDTVFAATTTAAAEVTAALSALEGSAVTRWSSDRIRVWSHRPWNNEGKQLAPVYTAAVSATARFRDFDALADVVERFATRTGVTITSIDWDLTEERRLEVTADVQARAVQDATVKATTYARAAGLQRVTAIAIADPGMLGDAGTAPGFEAPRGRGAAPMLMKAMDAGAPELTFTPDRLEVSASVDARFRAS